MFENKQKRRKTDDQEIQPQNLFRNLGQNKASEKDGSRSTSTFRTKYSNLDK